MRVTPFFLAAGLLAAAPAVGQGPAPQQPPANPYQELFTRWAGANRESIRAETGAGAETVRAGVPDAGNSIPASSPLQPSPRAYDEAVALGERVGAVVRAGDCAQGERIAREAGDFALVRAVRAHCRRGD